MGGRVAGRGGGKQKARPDPRPRSVGVGGGRTALRERFFAELGDGFF